MSQADALRLLRAAGKPSSLAELTRAAIRAGLGRSSSASIRDNLGGSLRALERWGEVRRVGFRKRGKGRSTLWALT